MNAQNPAFAQKPWASKGSLDSGDRSNGLRVVLRSDGPGVVEVPELDVPRLAVYVGHPVRLDCRHGSEHHSGLAIHGDIDIVPDRMPSRWEMKEPDTALVLRLSRALLRQAAEDSTSGDRIEIRSRFRVRDTQIEHIAWALMDEAQSGYPSGRLYLDCLGTALAVQLLRNHSSLAALRPCRRYGMPPWKLRRVQCYIEENLQCDLSLDMIAAVADMSASHLKGTFRMATGMPVHRYVIRRRVERAALLLRGGKLPISQIAVEVGFAHQSHLAMHMKRLTGLSPSQAALLA
jgi:AraC family transcriptional regulator